MILQTVAIPRGQVLMASGNRVTAHDVNERARLILHRSYAEKIDARPELADAARAFAERSIAADGGTTGQRLWLAILELPWQQVRERTLRDDPEGRLLRSDSPFSHITGIGDERERRDVWRRAKAELGNLPTASGAGCQR